MSLVKPTARFSWADRGSHHLHSCLSLFSSTTHLYQLSVRKTKTFMFSSFKNFLSLICRAWPCSTQQLITSQSGIIEGRSEPTTAWRPQADPRPEAWPTCRNWADPGDPDPIALPPCIDNLREVGAGYCPGMRAIIIIRCKSNIR